MGWSKIEFLGKNKYLTSSYAWVGIVPICTILFKKIDQIAIHNITLNLKLPFSWHIFYFSALSFAVGKTLYSIFCPELLRKYNNFSDYLSDGKKDITLRYYLKEAIKPINSDKAQLKVNTFYKDFCKSEGYVEDSLDKIDELKIREEKLGDAFWYVRKQFETIKIFFFWQCFFFYIIGSLLLLYVIYDNTINVFNSFISQL